MTYERCGIVAELENKSRYLEIKTDRSSYLLGDVVLISINAKMNQTPKYKDIFVCHIKLVMNN